MTEPLHQLNQWFLLHYPLMASLWTWAGLSVFCATSYFLILRQINRYRRALVAIKAEGGKVCDEFETCEHPVCQSNYAAWSLADKALSGGWKGIG